MAKSRDAFRTISEVADVLDTPAHVLRFWESKFAPVKPVKRAGGRRYYRPDDVALLAGIKDLLHEQGMTIKGAQKLLREKGVKHVIALSSDTGAAVVATDPPVVKSAQDAVPQTPTETAVQAEMFATYPAAAPAPKPQATPIQILGAKRVPDAPIKVEAALPELDFAPLDLPLVAPPQAPFDDLKLAKSKPPLPQNPAPRAGISARCLAAAVDTDHTLVAKNAAQIAPLLSRLGILRDAMRQPW